MFQLLPYFIKQIPFEVAADPFYSKENLQHLETITKDIKNGKATFREHKLIELD